MNEIKVYLDESISEINAGHEYCLSTLVLSSNTVVPTNDERYDHETHVKHPVILTNLWFYASGYD